MMGNVFFRILELSINAVILLVTYWEARVYLGQLFKQQADKLSSEKSLFGDIAPNFAESCSTLLLNIMKQSKMD